MPAVKKRVKRKQPPEREVLSEAMEELYKSQEVDDEEVIRHLKKCLSICDKAKGDFKGDNELPPVHILKSAAYNLCGEHYMDKAMQEAGQLIMTGDDLQNAKDAFLQSLKCFNNTSAQLSLAGLARDSNNIKEAIHYYRQCLVQPPLTEIDSSWEWVDQFVSEPFSRGNLISRYQLLLLTHLIPSSSHKSLNLLTKAELADTLSIFGIKFSISSKIWQLNTQSKATLRKQADLPKAGDRIQLQKLLTSKTLDSLCTTLSPGSCYWNETGYSGRGYFSWVYSPEKQPSILIEDLIKNVVIKNSGLPEGAVKCTEWWTHTRLPGRDIGHQLHFDTEEKTLEETGEIIHPLLSCVLYIAGTETGGNTIVINQGTDPKDVADSHKAEGWMSHPEDGSVLYFPGNLLHGVLPSPINENTTPGGDGMRQRLTILVALWDRPQSAFAQRANQTVGPQAELPTTSNWVVDMKKSYKSMTTPVQCLNPIPLPVTHIDRAWDEHPTPSSHEQIPKSIDQRFFAVDLDFRQVLIDDHLNCDEEMEEDEECSESTS